MKPFYATLLLAPFYLLSTLRADVTIVQKVDGMGQDAESTTEIKGGKVRIDASPAQSVIVDQSTGGMISLMHAEKKYLMIPTQLAQAAMEGMKMQGDKSGAAPTLVATGKKDTINGYPCEEYTCTISGTKLTLWLTKALPDYQAVLKEMAAAFNQGPMAEMMKNLGVDFSALPGFPMRTINELRAKGQDGEADKGQSVTSTVISVSTKPIADVDFTVPANYEAMKMPSLTPPGAEQAPAVSK